MLPRVSNNHDWALRRKKGTLMTLDLLEVAESLASALEHDTRGGE